jgi:hypothetical protein
MYSEEIASTEPWFGLDVHMFYRQDDQVELIFAY